MKSIAYVETKKGYDKNKANEWEDYIAKDDDSKLLDDDLDDEGWLQIAEDFKEIRKSKLFDGINDDNDKVEANEIAEEDDSKVLEGNDDLDDEGWLQIAEDFKEITKSRLFDGINDDNDKVESNEIGEEDDSKLLEGNDDLDDGINPIPHDL